MKSVVTCLGRLRLLALIVGLGAVGCGSRPLQVGSVQLGRAVNEDGTVAKFTTTFKPNDKIYLSVLTTDLGSGTITVRWAYNGHPAGERSKAVSYKLAAATEFQMESTEGFPVGPYTVDVLLDGKRVTTRSFNVEP